MGRLSKIDLLPNELKHFVDTTIRTHRYQHLDQMKEALSLGGVQISRSALHRYSQNLAELDAMNHGSPHNVIVVVMERDTGSTATFTTAADKQRVISALESLNLP